MVRKNSPLLRAALNDSSREESSAELKKFENVVGLFKKYAG